MKYLYLVRHGHTAVLDGPAPGLPGDAPLSPQGEQQARALAVELRPRTLDLVLSSVYRRAQQTAALLAERAPDPPVPVYASHALNEFFLRPDGAGVETTEQGLVRSLGFLNQFRPYADHIGIVGHNAILTVLRLGLLNAEWSTGQGAFAQPGRCRVLRYDPDQGDGQWREVEVLDPPPFAPAAG